ncbi:uncharacterized protein L969DRAFT_90761 [Mixia osmundae IAM 14324]|uniref:RING-type domain-containing protein n=1 Tax=Mixia osmundae (strain CBS 9802 / IAM 14324 / JCM 22182 / KY 12970) TaxID=764103 RepID=G7DW49_MIXOS|nr:uncharacterized protein L969DRAFT_90761 [Mixia osmundae IAM 14324]KEI36447.1 hypothetical protein L969DRAFT_90761 [Mixia osmundae IAM 14324]GAA94855.1 hypothetical protein E5Q_01509 [Mixia osmundae IAM 14324]
MVKHSRNSTARQYLSNHERNIKHYGTQTERLGADSMRNFDACALCLQRARDPRSCTQGHLFCHECIVNSLLTQKKEAKRQQLVVQRVREQEEQEQAEARSKARARVLAEFEQSQSTRGIGKSSSATSTPAPSTSTSLAIEAPPADEKSTKRKFKVEQGDIDQLQREAEDQALAQIAIEQNNRRKDKLPSFWLPSLTPAAKPTRLPDVPQQTVCHCTKPPHPLSLKDLFEVRFTAANDNGETSGSATTASESSFICGPCRRTITQNTKVFAHRPCGHVICQTCTVTLSRPSGQCPQCDTPLIIESKSSKSKKSSEKVDQPLPATILELSREGTGYAAGGVAEAKRFDLPFQG